MEFINPDPGNTEGVSMNKHSLYYHTRLHDWYRQHNIMQDKQSYHHGTAACPPSLVEGTGHLTADKLNFIHDWCLEVNKSFFTKEKKKTTKFTPKHRQLKQSPYSKDASMSTDLKPVRTTDRLVMNVKSFTKQTGTLTNAAVKANKPHVGLADKHRYQQHSKKVGISNPKAGKDLCVVNSIKQVTDGKDGNQFGHSFLTTTRSQLKQKHNENRSSTKVKNATLSESLVGSDNIYGYYGFISAIVRNVAQCNDNSRVGVSNLNDERPNQQASVNSENDCKQHKLLTSRCESFQQSRIENLNPRQVNKTQLEEKEKVESSFSSLQDGVGSDDNEIIVTSVSCVECAHRGNIEHVRNIDHCPSGRSFIENKQDNRPNEISDKENNSNLSTISKENESIYSITGVMKDKINYINGKGFSTQEYSKEKQWTGIESHPIISHDAKHVRLAKNGGDINRSFEDIVKESSEKNAKENNKQCKAMIISEVKLSDCDTTEHKCEGLTTEHKCEGLTTKQKCEGLHDLLNATTGRVSYCAATDSGKYGGESCTDSETATIGHFCLSNNLLNVLTIDDCKISQRYSLLKTGASAKEDVKTEKRTLRKVKEVPNNPVTETIKDNRKMKAHFSQSIQVNSAAVRKNRTITLENSAPSYYEGKRYRGFERGFRVLINDKIPIQEDQLKTFSGQKIAGFVKKPEGPIYRRLHAALRKQIEELRPNHCVKLHH